MCGASSLAMIQPAARASLSIPCAMGEKPRREFTGGLVAVKREKHSPVEKVGLLLHDSVETRGVIAAARIPQQYETVRERERVGQPGPVRQVRAGLGFKS